MLYLGIDDLIKEVHDIRIRFKKSYIAEKYMKTAQQNTMRPFNELCPACKSDNIEELPTTGLLTKMHCRSCGAFFGLRYAQIVTNIFWAIDGDEVIV